MAELVRENWLLLVIALVVGLLVAWWVFVASRRTSVQIERKDDDAPARRNQALIDAPARRNQALIDAPRASAVPPPTPPDLAGAGEAVAAAAPPAPAAPERAVGKDATDDLTRIKGLGPKLAEQLGALGVTRYEQIAAWDDEEIDRIDAQLGRFQGRIRRDDWPGQARLLGAGDTGGYEAKYGKL